MLLFLYYIRAIKILSDKLDDCFIYEGEELCDITCTNSIYYSHDP
jgi:hypothetical protein